MFKKLFNDLGKKEYTFENGGKTAHVTTNNMLVASSFSIEFKDAATNMTSTQTRFTVLQNITGEGVKKAKDLCGITG